MRGLMLDQNNFLPVGSGWSLTIGKRGSTLPVKAIAARVRLGTSKAANSKLHKYIQTVPEAMARAQAQWEI